MVLSSPRSGRAPCRRATRMATIEIRGVRWEPWAPALALITSCAPAPLSAAGARVQLARAPGAGCALVAPLRGSAGYNGRAAETNAADVEIYLRNQAADHGGDTLVITSRQLGAGRAGGPRDDETLSQPRGAGSGGCPNCVAITANAYRCSVTMGGAQGPPQPPLVNVGAQGRAAEPEPPFASEAAQAALGAAAASAGRCHTAGGPTGDVRVKVTFAATGDVVYCEVEDEAFAGAAAASCIARKFRNAHVPPFAGEARSLTATVRLAE